MSSIQERIRLIIEKKGLNQNSFSKKIGIQPQTLHHIIAGRLTNPSFEIIQKIISTFSDINPTWLITGNGDIFYTPQNTPQHTPESRQKAHSQDKGSFKQSLNTGPPPGENKECEKCKEKERTIEAQRTTIYSQQELIKS
jgi:DNA-binding XRE family transcriptional regulator